MSGRVLDQSEHERINAREYPGTRQLCELCGEPTERCEEDAIYEGDLGPLCIVCYARIEGRWDVEHRAAHLIRRLTDAAQEDRDDFALDMAEHGCTCFISPPCSFCLHPGNPQNQEEDECWEAALDIRMNDEVVWMIPSQELMHEERGRVVFLRSGPKGMVLGLRNAADRLWLYRVDIDNGYVRHAR